MSSVIKKCKFCSMPFEFHCDVPLHLKSVVYCSLDCALGKNLPESRQNELKEMRRCGDRSDGHVGLVMG